MLFKCTQGYRQGEVLHVAIEDRGLEKWGSFIAGYKNHISPSKEYAYFRLLKISTEGMVLKFDKCLWVGEGK